MICLLVMTFILINGIETAEHKTRLSGTILRDDDIDSKTKAWLLMVESGKVDEDHIRKITPKSIFIAPLLTNRSNKCKEGYRHDHLGQCVKVIKLDQRAQLEMLLKRLSAMYSEKKVEQEGLAQISNEPLHFSLPISSINATAQEEAEPLNNSNTVTEESTTMHPGVQNSTDEVDYPGIFNETEVNEESELDALVTTDVIKEYTTLIPEHSTEFTEGITDPSATEVPTTTEYGETTTAAETDQSKDFLPVDTGIKLSSAAVQDPIIFPNEGPSRIIFPDSYELSSRYGEARPQATEYPIWNTNYQHDVHKLPPQQFWWLPHSWRVDEEQRRPTVFKFWSHMPLVHDPSLVAKNKPNREFISTQPLVTPFHPHTRIPEGVTIELQQPLTSYRRGRMERGRRTHIPLTPSPLHRTVDRSRT